MTAPEPAVRGLDSDEFREVIGHFATGVTVITAVEDDEFFGTTASAVSSLSLEPPMLLICMNLRSATGACVGRVRRFAVNILDERQGHLARRFASKAPDKFGGVDVVTGRYGEPLLAGALAHVECHVVEEVSGGSHTVFLGEAHRASAGTGTPLAYYRGQFGRLELAGTSKADVSEDASRARCAVELGAAALSIGAVSPQGLRELRELMEATRPERARLSIEEWAKADRAFHLAAIRLSGSEALLEAYERLPVPVPEGSGAPGGATVGVDQHLADDHARIVEAYERADLAAATNAIRSDYQRTLRLTLDQLG